ncbi:DNA (cytosine-5-)-methyltransferase [Desulfonema ishimotonii]|uniref:DNA (cytosine-5-)-methyltransferase n=2 Tax=Desulfonema ishimotonii TaxID=45657 RepID=A0A401FRK6_9BACT|nr:DNA (cytosine-5-)-methyltransferase [Desulfonema ishimotonii]
MSDPKIKSYKNKSNLPVMVDFFCGAGGFTRGALDAGVHVICGIDCDERAKNTYEKNNKNYDGASVKFITKRLEDIRPDDLNILLKPFKKHPLIFVGCPPCQPFTNLGTEKKRSDNSKGALAIFIEFVAAFQPEFVVVENVPGIRDRKYGNIWTDALIRLENIGYSVRHEVVNAKWYGVPQTRRRTLLIASLHEKNPPWPVVKYGLDNYKKVRDALRNGVPLARLEAGEKCLKDSLHSAASLSDLNLKRIRAIKKPGGSRTDWPEELLLDCYKNFSGYTDIYGRMDWNKPSPTLTTRFNSLSNGRFGHPEEDRAITPREGALLQTFPPNYNFSDTSVNVNVRHIGNAVPPLLAKEIVAAIMKRIESCSDYVEADPDGSV